MESNPPSARGHRGWEHSDPAGIRIQASFFIPSPAMSLMLRLLMVTETSLTIRMLGQAVGIFASLKRNSSQQQLEAESKGLAKMEGPLPFWEGIKKRSLCGEWWCCLWCSLSSCGFKTYLLLPNPFLFFLFFNLDSWQGRAVLSRHKVLSVLVPVSSHPLQSDSLSPHQLGSHHQSRSYTPWDVNTVSYVEENNFCFLKMAFWDSLM